MSSLQINLLIGGMSAGVLLGLIAGVVALIRMLRVSSKSSAFLNLKCPECRFDLRGQFDTPMTNCPECGVELPLQKWRSNASRNR